MNAVLFGSLLLAAATPTPPVAAKHPHDVVSPYGTRNDPYYWLRDDTRQKPEVLDYLKAENAYYAAMTAPFATLTATLEKELVGRIQQDDDTVPYKDRDYRYWSRYQAGQQYAVHLRQAVAGGPEQVIVDVNKEAAGHEFYAVGGRAVSPKQDLVAFAEDLTGRRQYTLRFRDIASGKDVGERIPGLRPGVAWANDNKTVFYVENDPVTLLSTRVKRHVLGTDPKTDALVHDEKDTTFYLGVSKSGDDRYVLITLGSTESSETLVIDADAPTGAPRVLASRERGLRYEADHVPGRFIVQTDWQAPNYRLMSVEDAAIGDKARWKELLPYDPQVFIDGFVAFRDFLAINERSDGLLRIRVMPWSDPKKAFHLKSDEAAYAEGFSVNAEQDSAVLRYTYTSLATPDSVYEVDMRTGERKLLKRQAVVGYDPASYTTERVWAPARDGTRVPVSLVYKKGLKKDGTAPLFQYAYGSYGASIDPEFDSGIVSLLDRGFVYAIAHVRGGQELGRAWYEAGRLLHKKNTFTDFVDVTNFLVAEKYAAPDKCFAEGASAGGLLMGAVANLAPDRYRALLVHVPFVDAVTTSLDPSIPLVTNEYDEWCDPKAKACYDYLLSYSPYDNVAAKAYPSLLVTTSLYDSQVQYFEPAKWVARLRATKTDTNPLLFRINMMGGHGGRSGRFERLHQTAEEYAFLLHTLGVDR
jgi:oligopeptidase B